MMIISGTTWSRNEMTNDIRSHKNTMHIGRSTCIICTHMRSGQLRVYGANKHKVWHYLKHTNTTTTTMTKKKRRRKQNKKSEIEQNNKNMWPGRSNGFDGSYRLQNACIFCSDTLTHSIHLARWCDAHTNNKMLIVMIVWHSDEYIPFVTKKTAACLQANRLEDILLNDFPCSLTVSVCRSKFFCVLCFFFSFIFCYTE